MRTKPDVLIAEIRYSSSLRDRSIAESVLDIIIFKTKRVARALDGSDRKQETETIKQQIEGRH